MDGHPRPRYGDHYAGTFVSLRDTTSAEIAAAAGYDIVFVDLEHSAVPYSPADYVRAVEAGGASAWIRADDTTSVQPWLDAGVRGVLFSRCTSANDAKGMVDRVGWPPLGARGLAASARVGRYGTKQVDFTAPAPPVSVGVIIEDMDGIAAHEEILSTPGIEMVVIGLTDLGIALAAELGTRSDTELADAAATHVENIGKVAAANDVLVTIPLGHKTLAAASNPLSFRPDMYLAGSDVTAISKAFATTVEAIRNA